MIRWLNQYKKSALFAMACGLVTVLLGVFTLRGYGAAAICAAIALNTLLHYESYFTTLLLEHRKNSNVLAMAIAETILLVFFAIALKSMGWQEIVILFSVYLVFNGTSLMAIPSAFSRYCGIAAAVLGAILFCFGREPGTLSAYLAGINLIVNGAERTIMSILGGKKP